MTLLLKPLLKFYFEATGVVTAKNIYTNVDVLTLKEFQAIIIKPTLVEIKANVDVLTLKEFQATIISEEGIMFITRVVENNVDAVSTPYAISIPFSGRPGRVIRMEASIKALSMFSGNGYAQFHLATKDASGVVEQEEIKTLSIFEMGDPALNREHLLFIDFIKTNNGSVDVEIQFLGALGVISASNVELIVTDIGAAEAASSIPTIISAVVEDAVRGKIKLITSRNMQSTAFDGFSVVGKTISGIAYQQTEVLLTVTADYDYNDTVQLAYDPTVASSDFRSVDTDEELAAVTFNGSNFTNKPPVVSGTVNLGILLQSASPKIYTDAELLVTATDPEGAGMSVTNIVINSGPGSIVDNLDGTHTYTESGTGAVVLNYDASDSEYETAVVANISVQTASTNEMTIDYWQINVPRRIDFIMIEDIDGTQPTTEQSAIAGFNIDGGYTIDRVKQNNPGSKILNIYLNQDIAIGVPFTLTYTKLDLAAGERVISTPGGLDFPEGPIVLTR